MKTRYLVVGIEPIVSLITGSRLAIYVTTKAGQTPVSARPKIHNREGPIAELTVET